MTKALPHYILQCPKMTSICWRTTVFSSWMSVPLALRFLCWHCCYQIAGNSQRLFRDFSASRLLPQKSRVWTKAPIWTSLSPECRSCWNRSIPNRLANDRLWMTDLDIPGWAKLIRLYQCTVPPKVSWSRFWSLFARGRFRLMSSVLFACGKGLIGESGSRENSPVFCKGVSSKKFSLSIEFSMLILLV